MTKEQLYRDALARICKRVWEQQPSNEATELAQIAQAALLAPDEPSVTLSSSQRELDPDAKRVLYENMRDLQE